MSATINYRYPVAGATPPTFAQSYGRGVVTAQVNFGDTDTSAVVIDNFGLSANELADLFPRVIMDATVANGGGSNPTSPIQLGPTVSTFAVLAGNSVTNSGSSVVTGNLGESPGSSITGFPPGTVVGSIDSGDSVSAQAQLELTAAYLTAAGLTPATTVSGDLGGQTLNAGVYNSASTLAVTGVLTLNGQGNPNAVFVFQMGSSLTMAVGSSIVLINGAQAANVYWQVTSSATINSGVTFIGTILALTSITVGTGSTVTGRLLARNAAVTLLTNLITNPGAALGPTAWPAFTFSKASNSVTINKASTAGTGGTFDVIILRPHTNQGGTIGINR